MKQKFIDAAVKYWEGQLAFEEANLSNMLTNPVGVGEHPVVMESINDLAEKIVHATDMLNLFKGYQEQISKTHLKKVL